MARMGAQLEEVGRLRMPLDIGDQEGASHASAVADAFVCVGETGIVTVGGGWGLH